MGKEKINLVKNKPPHLDDIYACLQCGYCKAVCPIYRETGWESFTPRGKVYLLKHLISKNSFLDKILGKKIADILTGKGKISLEEAMTKIFTCTLCSRCETICHVDIPFHEYWEEIRKWMVENGIDPPENTINMYKYILMKYTLDGTLASYQVDVKLWVNGKYFLNNLGILIYYHFHKLFYKVFSGFNIKVFSDIFQG